MSRLITLVLAFICLWSGTATFACVCNTPPLTTKQLDTYKYISLVKIKNLKPVKVSSDYYEYMEAEVGMLEIFKGGEVKKILITGVHSSCDMGVNEGSYWIIFANDQHNYPTITACSYNQEFPAGTYHPSSWSYPESFSTINFLRNVFEKFPADGFCSLKFVNGKPAYKYHFKKGRMQGEQLMFDAEGNKISSTFYNDSMRNGASFVWDSKGQLLCRCTYQNDLLEGNCERYFFDGKPNSRGNYHYGKLHGPNQEWDIYGNLVFKGNFKNGLMTDTCIRWYTIDTSYNMAKLDALSYKNISVDSVFSMNKRRQIEILFVNDSAGNLIHRIDYYRNGNLKKEVNFEPNSKIYFEHNYDFNGITTKVFIYQITGKNKYGSNIIKAIFQETVIGNNGRRIRKTFYDTNGENVIKAVELENGRETVVYEMKKSNK